MKKWLREIVDEFKSLSVEQRVARLNETELHDIIRTIEAANNSIKPSFVMSTQDLISFSLAALGIGVATEIDFDTATSLVLDCAANDERFALAA